MNARGLRSLVATVNLRHVGGKRLRTVLTVAGIAAGVALAFSISVINATLLSSFRSSIRELAGAAEIEVAAADPTGLPADSLEVVESVEGVDDAVPVLRSIAEVSNGGGSERILFMGVTPEITSLFPTETSPFTDLDVTGGLDLLRGGLILSSKVADDIDAEIGDDVAVETPSGPRDVALAGTVSGRTIGLFNGGRVAILPFATAQDLFAKQDRVDSIYVVVAGDASVGDVEGEIDDALDGAAVVGPPGERGEGLERVFNGIGRLLSMTGTVSLFVALFVVYNTMSMSLAERRREISMMLAFGATRRQVFAAFLAEAGTLGVVASGVGIGGGLLLARALVEPAVRAYRILPLTGAGPLVVDSNDVVLAVVAGIAVSLVGAYLPARRVLKIAPVESLRPDAAYEWERGALPGVGAGAGAVIGLGALAASAAFVVAFTVMPDNGWLANVGLLFGLTGVTFLLPRIVPIAVKFVSPVLKAVFGTPGRLAADALDKNPGRTTFTVAALVLSLAVAIGAGTALGSYERQVEATASALVGADLYVSAESYSGFTSDQPLPAELRDDIAELDGVGFVYPLRFTMVNIGDEQGLIYAVPIREAVEAGATSELSAISSTDPDEWIDDLEAGGVSISPLTAERHGLEVADSIALPTPRGEQHFEVTSTFNDLVSFDSLYMDYETYTRFWNDTKVDEFGVLVDDGAELEEVRNQVERFVAQRGISADVFDKEELVGRILEIVEGSLSLGRGIQLAALIVAALVIANTLFTAVLERRWEMGLQRALGMSRGALARSVLLEAGAIGFIGGAGGAILGMINGYLMTQVMEAQFLWRIAFRPSALLLALAIVGGTLLAAAAGAVPSRIASRASIIESLRYE